jgi:hypothetical protein
MRTHAKNAAANTPPAATAIDVIKQCGLYSEEYKQWIARGKANAAATPQIVETFNSFKTFWAEKITLVNQTAIPAALHGYGIMATADDESVISYEESLATFGAAYAATQDSVKSQASTIATLQSQMQSMQQAVACSNCSSISLQMRTHAKNAAAKTPPAATAIDLLPPRLHLPPPTLVPLRR